MKREYFNKCVRFARPGGEKGMALIIALMLLAMLSLLGASALLTTNVDLKISGNTRAGKTAFFKAEGAAQVTGGAIEDCITDVGWEDNYVFGTGVTIKDGEFPFETRGYDDDGDPAVDDRDGAPDIVVDTPLDSAVDVDKGQTVPVAGSSILGASGYEGIGKGAAGGGMKIVYHIQVRGEYGTRAMSLLFMSYDHFI
jgi:hypothetical protein